MKKILYIVALLLNCIALANAKLPAKCIDRLINKSENMLEKVTDAIKHDDRLPANDYMQLSKYWGEFNTYVKSKWTQDCYAAATENKDKYYKFYNDNARPIMHKALARQSELCSRVTESIINSGMKEINIEISRNSTSGAEGRISALEFKLKQKPIILSCPPVKDKIASLLNDELPMLRNNLNAMKQINKIRYNYKNIVGPWDEAQLAFKEKNLAPNFGVQNQVDYKNALHACLEAVNELEKINFDNAKLMTIFKGKKIVLSDIKNDCIKIKEFGLKAFFDKVNKHNKEYWSKWKNNWVEKHIKGDAMLKIFKENKEISPVVKDIGKSILWSYRSYTTNHLFHNCKIYTFDVTGTILISLKKVLCE